MSAGTDQAMLGASGYVRQDGDLYPTEPWVTQALLDAVQFRGMIWEPAAGRGDMAEVLYRNGYEVWTSDIRGADLGCESAMRGDFLADFLPIVDGADIHPQRAIIPKPPLSIVTNPPYTLAEEFVRHALKLTERSGGMVAMLFRNEWDCAASRRDLFERESFAAKLVLTKRPRWLGPGAVHTASPRHNFAWMIWDHHHSGPAHIRWIPKA